MVVTIGILGFSPKQIYILRFLKTMLAQNIQIAILVYQGVYSHRIHNISSSYHGNSNVKLSYDIKNVCIYK